MIEPRISVWTPHVGNETDGEPFVYWVCTVSWMYAGDEYGFSITTTSPDDLNLEQEILTVAKQSQARLGQI